LKQCNGANDFKKGVFSGAKVGVPYFCSAIKIKSAANQPSLSPAAQRETARPMQKIWQSWSTWWVFEREKAKGS
jgi:hypothetical protein